MTSPLSTLLKSSGSSDVPEGDRQASAFEQDARHPHARDWRSRVATLLPWALLLGFFGLLALMFGGRLVPARSLSVESVVTIRQSAETAPAATREPSPENTTSPPKADSPSVSASASMPADAFEGPMLFQASGWVEPDPYPVMATALVDGVVASVEVLEGERVKRGQLLASLIDDDAKLDLETAKAKLASLKALAEAHHQQIAAAEAEIVSLDKQVSAAKARRDIAADIATRLQKVSGGSVSGQKIAQADLELALKNAEMEALAATEAELTANVDRHTKMHADFAARITEANTEIARKQLALDRTRIESPIDGRVLRLLAVPGQKKMLGMDDPESAIVAILYDPESLQARIDVPLSEAAQLTPGQPVRLRSELLPDKIFHGQVTRIVGEADLQRNTLQAKVAIANPDGRLRPAMLCRAEFLPAATPESTAPDDPASASTRPSAGERVRVFVPVSALTGNPSSGDESQHQVWKVNRSGDRVVPQVITLGREQREDHRLVLDGLKPGDRVVLDPPSDLENGERFRLSDSPSPSDSALPQDS